MKILEKRLFIISNNTHYLNVQTYIESHPPGENDLIFLNKYSKGFEKFIENIKENQNIKLFDVISDDKKQKFPLNKFELIFFFTKVLWMKRKFGKKYNTIFISNYLSWQQHFILRQFGQEKITLINDGTAIFKTIDLRKSSKKINFPHINFLINKHLSSKTVENLHFYSPINLEVAEYDTLEIFNFKASENLDIDIKKIYFVSSDLVELGFLKLEHHLNYLHQIKKMFSNCHITYFAHRGEREGLLEQYTFLGNVVRDSIPFEERMEKEKVLPGIIISYISSILINLPQVYPQIQFYYFPLVIDDILPKSSFASNYFPIKENFKKTKNINLTEFELD